MANWVDRQPDDPPATEEDEARDRRMFHLHDDPADCDEPEVHFGEFGELGTLEGRKKEGGWL